MKIWIKQGNWFQNDFIFRNMRNKKKEVIKGESEENVAETEPGWCDCEWRCGIRDVEKNATTHISAMEVRVSPYHFIVLIAVLPGCQRTAIYAFPIPSRPINWKIYEKNIPENPPIISKRSARQFSSAERRKYWWARSRMRILLYMDIPQSRWSDGSDPISTLHIYF